MKSNEIYNVMRGKNVKTLTILKICKHLLINKKKLKIIKTVQIIQIFNNNKSSNNFKITFQ